MERIHTRANQHSANDDDRVAEVMMNVVCQLLALLNSRLPIIDATRALLTPCYHLICSHVSRTPRIIAAQTISHNGNILQLAQEQCCHTWCANDCASFPPKPLGQKPQNQWMSSIAFPGNCRAHGRNCRAHGYPQSCARPPCRPLFPQAEKHHGH